MFGSFAHSKQTKMTIRSGKHVFGIKPSAVVLDTQLQVGSLEVQFDEDVFRLGMLDRVCQSLLPDPKRVILDLARQPSTLAGDPNLGNHRSAFSHLPRAMRQRGCQVVGFQRLRSQVPDRAPGFYQTMTDHTLSQ